jgi:hypothetical protein
MTSVIRTFSSSPSSVAPGFSPGGKKNPKIISGLQSKIFIGFHDREF